MKKLLLSTVVLLCVSGAVSAQTKSAKQKNLSRTQTVAPKATKSTTVAPAADEAPAAAVAETDNKVKKDSQGNVVGSPEANELLKADRMNAEQAPATKQD